MSKKPPIDPLRVELLEIIQTLADRTIQLRDYGTTPGNAWLAKGELQSISLLMSDLEAILEAIKEDDAENGY
jgi:hypothetical protein